jgi:hypothetical protein
MMPLCKICKRLPGLSLYRFCENLPLLLAYVGEKKVKRFHFSEITGGLPYVRATVTAFLVTATEEIVQCVSQKLEGVLQDEGIPIIEIKQIDRDVDILSKLFQD